MMIWEITNLCNLSCLHCCTNSSPHISTKNEVSDSDVFKAIEEFDAIPIKEVMFSGGEPFLRPRLIDFIKSASAKHTDVYIASNGTLISESIAEKLREYSIKRIDVSLDGDISRIHKEIRLSSTSFNRTVRGIQACVKNEVPLRVSTMITPNNYKRLNRMLQLLLDLGVRAVVISSVQNGSGRAMYNAQLNLEDQLKESVNDVIVSALDKYSSLIKIDCRVFQKYSSAPTGCPAGKTVLHISTNGDVSPCSWLYKIQSNRFTLGNVKWDSLAKCIERSKSIIQPLTLQTKGCLIPYVHTR